MAHKLFLTNQSKFIFLLDPNQKSPELLSFKEKLDQQGVIALLQLLNMPLACTSNHDLFFWQKFVSLIFRDFCNHSELDVENMIDTEGLQTLLQKSFPGTNHELLNFDKLKSLSNKILEYLKNQSSLYQSTKDFLLKEFPEWSEVAQIFFHLAENPKPGQNNFVFLASYTTRYSSNSGLQHITFEKALFEKLKESNQNKVQQLLKPIEEASKKSALLRELIQGKKLFGPAVLSREETFAFLEDCHFYEEAGITVKFPRSWNQSKPSQAKVQITLEDSSEASLVGFHALFKFKANVMIDNEVLSEAELQSLLSSSENLIQIRGRWIQINQNKISEILTDWQKASQIQQKGLSFIEAMRLIAHYKTGQNKTNKECSSDLISIKSSQSLRDLLKNLTSPDTIQNQDLESLSNFGFKAELRPYQTDGFKWLCFLKDRSLGGILADDMGLGKTIQIIALLLREKYKSPQSKCLLVVPASLLGNWQNEVKKFAPELRINILHRAFNETTDFQNESIALTNYDIILTSYKMACKVSWIFSKQWNLLVIDEAQTIKSPEANLTKEIKKIQASCKFALTGTPVENNLVDLWSLFDFCLPSLLGPFPWFKKFYQQMVEDSSFAPLKKIIQPYLLRRVKTDRSIIKDLPQKIEKKTYCNLSSEQIECYKEELENLAKALKEDQGDMKRKGLVLKYLMRFKQICNHPAQHLGDQNYQDYRSGKFLVLKNLAEQIAAKGEKLIVFTQFKELTIPLHKTLESAFKEKGLILHGGTPVNKRKEFVEAFQGSSQFPFFILSLKAGGSGLNLTKANHVIHFDRWWNPSVENQATDRSFRIGQTANVIVHKFICSGTLEQKIDQIIEKKIHLIDSVVSSTQLKLTELDDKKLLELLNLDLIEPDVIDIKEPQTKGPLYAL